MDNNQELIDELQLEVQTLKAKNAILLKESNEIVKGMKLLEEDNENLVKKSLQSEKDLVKQVNENVHLKNQNAMLNDELYLFKNFPEIHKENVLMEYQLKLAKQFSEAKAFGQYTPQQIYTLMKAGAEMGMTPIESLQTLYIVNGAIDFFGDKMIARITQNGYKVEYLNEERNVKVTVRITKGDEQYEETVHKDDEILKKSKAMGFSPLNKLRFHGVRMIASFYLPHLFKGVSDLFTPAYREYEETLPAYKTENELLEDQIKDLIDNAKSIDELNDIKQQYVKELSKSVSLTLYWGKVVKSMK